jgi:hypothetical protein
MVIVLSIGPMVRGLKPGRERLVFKIDKNPYHNFVRRESKVEGLMSQGIAACY